MRYVEPIESDRLLRFDRELWTQVTARGRIGSYQAGERIYEQGGIDERLHLVLNGLVDLTRDAGNGSRFTGLIRYRGQTVANASLHLSTPKLLGAHARTNNTRLLIIDKPDLYELMTQSPPMMEYILRDLSSQHTQALIYLQEDRELGLDQRVARRIFEMSAHGLDIPVTQTQLAEIMGVSRISISKVLDQLVDQDVIEKKYRKIIVKSPEDLTSWQQNNG